MQCTGLQESLLHHRHLAEALRHPEGQFKSVLSVVSGLSVGESVIFE